MAKKKNTTKKNSRRSGRIPTTSPKAVAPLGLINHDVVIYDYETQAGRFFTEPAHPVVVRSDGVHRIRFWNESSSDIEFTFVPPLDGRSRITIPRNGSHTKTRVRPSDSPGRHHYKPERLKSTQSVSASESNGPVMITLSAGDPEIIVE
jgi:hypothetical protein